jgi:hypothetical protein
MEEKYIYIYTETEKITKCYLRRSNFWDISPCIPLRINIHFEKICSFYLQDRRTSQTRNKNATTWHAEPRVQFSSLAGRMFPTRPAPLPTPLQRLRTSLFIAHTRQGVSCVVPCFIQSVHKIIRCWTFMGNQRKACDNIHE